MSNHKMVYFTVFHGISPQNRRAPNAAPAAFSVSFYGQRLDEYSDFHAGIGIGGGDQISVARGALYVSVAVPCLDGSKHGWSCIASPGGKTNVKTKASWTLRIGWRY